MQPVPPATPNPPDGIDHHVGVSIILILILLIIAVIIGLIYGYDGELGRRLYSH